MASDNTASKNGLSEQGQQRTLLLQKIRDLLAQADPDTWRKGGEEFISGRAQEKPRQTWEELYTLEIPKGVLAFRRSTPVKSEFLGRGFVLTRAAVPDYFVELHVKGWHHSELTDPYKRSGSSDKSFTLLAEASIAQELYDYVTDYYNKYHNQKQAEFDREALTAVKLLTEKLQVSSASSWARSEEADGLIRFTGKTLDMQIDVSKTNESGREYYQLLVKRGRELSKIRDAALAQEIYVAVEELGQTSRLLTLSKALENL